MESRSGTVGIESLSQPVGVRGKREDTVALKGVVFKSGELRRSKGYEYCNERYGEVIRRTE